MSRYGVPAAQIAVGVVDMAMVQAGAVGGARTLLAAAGGLCLVEGGVLALVRFMGDAMRSLG